MKQKSYVYLFPLKDHSAFKIGKSNSPRKRFSHLLKFYELDYSNSLMFQCQSENDSFIIESIIHKSFKNNQYLFEFEGGTEFFHYNILPEVKSLINILSKQYDISEFTLPTPTSSLEIDKSNIDILSLKLGNAIKRKRLLLNINQSQLSNIVNTTRQTIARLENGNGNASINTVLSIMDALDMTDFISELYNDKSELNRRVRI